jgi:hypothetical protein
MLRSTTVARKIFRLSLTSSARIWSPTCRRRRFSTTSSAAPSWAISRECTYPSRRARRLHRVSSSSRETKRSSETIIKLDYLLEEAGANDADVRDITDNYAPYPSLRVGYGVGLFDGYELSLQVGVVPQAVADLSPVKMRSRRRSPPSAGASGKCWCGAIGASRRSPRVSDTSTAAY